MLVIKLRAALITLILILNFSKFAFTQDKYPIINAPLYDIEDNIKIISDSTLLNGYIIFEYTKQNEHLGFDKEKKFFTFIVYFVLTLEDLFSINSVKLYYNSNKLAYNFFSFSKNSISDTIKFAEREKFKKIHDIYLENSKSKNKPFRIEKLDFDILSESNMSFFQSDTSDNKGFFIFSCRVPAFLFITQTNNIFEANPSRHDKISLLFFEPLVASIIFEPVADSLILSKGFSKSRWIWDYMGQ